MKTLNFNPELKRYDCGIDTEYFPQTDKPTIPISVQLYIPEYKEAKFFINPNANPTVLKHAKRKGIPIFEHPLVLFDYTLWKYRRSPLKEKKGGGNEKLITVNLIHYWSIKDLEFQFRDRDEYLETFLPNLSKTRRLTATRQGITASGNTFLKFNIKTNYQVLRIDDNGNEQWLRLAFQVTDLSAMQGNIGQKQAEMNAGLVREETDKLSYDEIINPEQTFINKTKRFIDYACRDAKFVYDLRKSTNNRYNQIAELIGVPPRDEFGLTTGRIVGTLLHNAIAHHTGLDKKVTVYDKEQEKYLTMDLLSLVNKFSGTNWIADTARGQASGSVNLFASARLHYLSMTDGGRAVRERLIRSVKHEDLLIDGDRYGALVDIDINGCYGNGLKNQLCAVGIPRVSHKVLTFGEFYKQYYQRIYNKKGVKTPKLIPGLWYARISWKKAPFKQDLLLSKDLKIHVPTGIGASDYQLRTRTYKSNFCLLTNEINRAALNHDTVQLMRRFCNKAEWKWISENALVVGIVYYDSKDECKTFSEDLYQDIYENTTFAHEASPGWVRYEFKDLMTTLANERAKHPKKGTVEQAGMNNFLKLVINTIYGCTASQYFSDPDRTVSNVVIGNNITARARCLGWLMAKGFHSYMTITDGGVFDLNKVLDYKTKNLSLDWLEGLSEDKFSYKQKDLDGNVVKTKRFCYQTHLMDEPTTYDEAQTDLDTFKQRGKERSDLDDRAWQHLKSQFGGDPKKPIDILDQDQFTFETKSVYVEMHLNNKINYTLIKPSGDSFVAYRGFPKVYNYDVDRKVTDPRAKELLLALDPTRYDIKDSHIIGLKEWINKNKDGGFLLLDKHEIEKLLLPGDTEQINRVYYSHTPLYMRHKNLSQYKKHVRDYSSVRNHYRESYDDDYAQESADAIYSLGRDGL